MKRSCHSVHLKPPDSAELWNWRRQKITSYPRDRVLDRKALWLHETQKRDGAFKSGRMGAYVYYVRNGQQRWRRHVVPRDPRTPRQLRHRRALAAASKAWSTDNLLTQQEREACYQAGAKVQSRPRLFQSGPLTAQQYFVGWNCSKVRSEQGMVLTGVEPSHSGSVSKSMPAPEVVVVAGLRRSPWERPATASREPPDQHRPTRCSYRTTMPISGPRLGVRMRGATGNCRTQRRIAAFAATQSPPAPCPGRQKPRAIGTFGHTRRSRHPP
jgi:hypothetical protein